MLFFQSKLQWRNFNNIIILRVKVLLRGRTFKQHSIRLSYLFMHLVWSICGVLQKYIVYFLSKLRKLFNWNMLSLSRQSLPFLLCIWYTYCKNVHTYISIKRCRGFLSVFNNTKLFKEYIDVDHILKTIWPIGTLLKLSKNEILLITNMKCSRMHEFMEKKKRPKNYCKFIAQFPCLLAPIHFLLIFL